MDRKKRVASSRNHVIDVRLGHDTGKIVLTAIAAVALLAVAPCQFGCGSVLTRLGPERSNGSCV